MLRRSSFIAAVLMASLCSAPAFAQSEADKTTARQLASDGQDALDKKDYAAALDHFTRADALYHAPTLTLGIARAEAGLHRFVAATEAYNRLVRIPFGSTTPAFKKAVDDAKHEVEAIAPHLGWVTIHVTGPDTPTVSLDGASLPATAIGARRMVDPGEHTASAGGEGFATQEQKFQVGEGGSAEVSIALAKQVDAPPVPKPVAQAAPQPSPRKTIGFVALGVGGVGVVLGVVTGALALGKHGTLADTCKDGCPATAQSDIDGYHTMGTLSTVGFIVGGVGLAAGAVLVLTAPKTETAKPTSAFLRPYVGPGTFGAVGRF